MREPLDGLVRLQRLDLAMMYVNHGSASMS
jgi:hypothetical protein